MYYDENQPQMDAGNDNPEGLPTYNYLEEQERGNPNSRFGRWRSWVEKRAAERYADLTEEERSRRRNRGWGTTLDTDVHGEAPAPSSSIMSPSSAQLVSERLGPTSLSIYRFGSRFLPHSIAPIRSLIPLMDDRLLIIGSPEGVAVLDVFPENESLSADNSTLLHALEGAKRKDMWTGESIHQMTLLESTIDRSGSPQGVILALVSAEETDADREPVKSVRMYNLASMLSLAKWAASHKDAKPVVIQGPKGWNPQQAAPRRLHRHHPSTIAKSFKAMSLDHHHGTRPSSPPGSSSSIRTTPASIERTPPKHQESVDSTDSWEVVDDLPLRWATDYVNLANPGSKLASSQVQFYETWKNSGIDGRGTSMLAVATKTSILLYETPKGERAFRFVKEFYTPLPAKAINFLHQTTGESSRLSAMPSERLKKDRPPSHAGSEASLLGSPRIRRISTPGDYSYGSQLSLFVIFEKKAGLIRMSDSAVSEIELWDDGGAPPSPQPTGSLPLPGSGGSSFRKSLDVLAFGREAKGMWLPLTTIDVPLSPSEINDLPQVYAAKTLILMSRGRQTHIYTTPLPMPLANNPPLRVIRWQNPARQVTARLSIQPERETRLQVVAFTEAGVEVAESSLNFLFRPPERSSSVKGKGKVKSADVSSPSDPLLRSKFDFPNHVGFLARGGLWHDLDTESGPRPGFRRYNMEFDSTVWNNVNVEQGLGIYGWCYQGFEDYRVFWLGEDVSGGNGQVNRVVSLSEY